MPLKSKAQRRFLWAAEARGDVPAGTAQHFEDATPKGKKLPERLHKKAFVVGFWKVANLAESLKNHNMAKNLEYAGLGTLGALSAHDMYEGSKKHNKKQVAKGAIDAAGLGTLALATHLAHK